MKKISVLGSTGSIGLQTLDVIRRFPEKFSVVALTCRSSISLIKAQVKEFTPLLVSVESEEDARNVREYIRDEGLHTEVVFGPQGNIDCATLHEADTVVAAMVGMCGLWPVAESIRSGKNIALANKETLVAGGSFIMKAARDHGVDILPVDSEHSAIWQCIRGRANERLERIILTASGGPFRGYSREMLENVTREQVLKHPTWNMGGKITVDSATMMNKGLEVIEASWLFGIPVDRIDVVVHPQSVIHSMVSMSDGSILAQLGRPDMILPIEVALFYPDRGPRIIPEFDPFAEGINKLTFEKCDTEVFPALDLAFHAGRIGGSLPAVMNSANEEAVQAFLGGKTGYNRIIPAVRKCMEYHERSGIIKTPDPDSVFEADRWAREFVRADLF
ncbi:MAG: 1-deoxy-D-xylulose-5-phosphate reductoisomerase [Clostridiaceae bacterium]|nr:1-deoxy-D-xylulose-5-phosphate reductoisomerase [Clostridiaceae bacterium]